MQVVREHHRERNLLFAGTEYGVCFTIDGGAHWTRLGSGIPTVPVHDLAIQERENDLVVGTHGRGIFILDDLTPLEHLARAKIGRRRAPVPGAGRHTAPAGRFAQLRHGQQWVHGTEPSTRRHHRLPGERRSQLTHSAKLEVVDGAGTVVRQLPFNRQPGLYRQVWDMRVGRTAYRSSVDDTQPGGGAGGVAGWWRGGRGGAAGGEITFVAMPGAYRARLTIAQQAGARSSWSSPSRCCATRRSS